ncbi:hypothetical protein COCON_G00108180 [Conger conger]|uniref:Spermatogenesis-associated protein 2 PUB-like domain-containing protein n=1 Tax=Conger conger TaxID=82655 RepID=A0A9Q1DJ76_CONCO|nr:hypothetical protein COCON_G00108180 [Conger conger]
MDKNGMRGFGGICEQYRVSLEQRIAQGHIDLVCGDEELCRWVEGMLKEGDSREVLTVPGLDTQATMEDSLQAPPVWGCAVGGIPEPAAIPGLAAISKAFEFLERAALNLYMCPWRKEYRVMKLFSGMFTHLVRPALSAQQVAQLFGLLGYQSNGTELVLRDALPSAAGLLGLACAFFVARCESRLLSTASGGRPGAELTLVQERRKGLSLQVALESLQGKMDASAWGHMEDVDLYSEDACGEKVASAGEKLSTAPVSRESVCPPPAGGSSGVPTPTPTPTPSQSLHITLSQPGTTKSFGQVGKGAVSSTAENKGMGTAQGQNQTCTCDQYPESLLFDSCQQCNETHSFHCATLDICKKNKHIIKPADQDRSKKTKHNPRLLGDAALPGRTEGGASTALSKELKWMLVKV